MLEDLFVDRGTLRRLRSCVLARHLETFGARLQERGYVVATIRQKISVLGRLARWMEAKALAVGDLDERRARAFVDARSRQGWRRRDVEQTVLRLIEHLRSVDVLVRPAPTRDDSASAALLGRYEHYLRAERALAPCTVKTYLFLVRPFVVECLADGCVPPAALGAGRVREFLLARTRDVTPQRAQALACVLRSFLRFLFLRAETTVDLARAVPTVRRWRLAVVPRHISPDDVERVLRACSDSSPIGRRDHAILLLLARLGLRASEVMTLEVGDVRWREGEIVVRGKGLVRDRLPLLPDVGAAIALYLRKGRPCAACRRVFLCTRAPRRGFCHVSSVSTIVARAFTRAGLEPPHRGAHTLRHSLAATMVRRGATLTEIGEVLRHRSPATTEIYAKLDFGALRDVAMPWPTRAGGR